MQDAVKRFRSRRAARLGIKTSIRYDSVEEYRRRRAERMGIHLDADDEETGGKKKGGHGNTKIPFGLCQREGIEIQPGWTPEDAWKALEGKGYAASESYQELKKTGKVPVKGKPVKKDYSKMSYEDLNHEYEDLVRRYAKAEQDYEDSKRKAERASKAADIAIKIKARNDYHGESYEQIVKELESTDPDGDDFLKYSRLSHIKRIMDNLGHDVFDLDDGGIAARAKEVEEEAGSAVSFGELNEERNSIREARARKAQEKYRKISDCDSSSALEARIMGDDFFPAGEWLREQIDYQGMDSKAVTSVGKSLDSIKKRFPKLKGMLQPPLMNGEVEGNAYAQCSKRDSQVTLSKWSFRDAAFMQESLKNDVKTGFHPKGTGNIQAVVTHEYGHAIANLLTDRFRSELKGMSFSEHVLQKVVASNPGESPNSIMAKVSRYAAKSGDDGTEFLAEAFAEYCCSSKPRPIAVQVGQIMSEYINKL